MAILSRANAPPLLRTVGGKQHASDKDHEEPAQKKRRTDEQGPVKHKKLATVHAPRLFEEDDAIRMPPSLQPKASKPRPNSELLKEAIDNEPLLDDELRQPLPRKPVVSQPAREAYPFNADPLSSGDEVRKPPSLKQKATKSKTAEKHDFNADPLSSGDEIRKPPPWRQKAPKSKTAEEDDFGADPKSSGDGVRKAPLLKQKASRPSTAEEDNFDADPLSSGDEVHEPPPFNKPPMPSGSPQRRQGKKGPDIKIPASGSYAKGKAYQARHGGSENTENVSTAASPLSDGLVSDRGYTFSMEHSSQKSSQNTKSYGSRHKTTNLHRPGPAPKKTFGKAKGVLRVGSAKGDSWDVKAPIDNSEEDSEEDSSRKEPVEFEPEELDAVLNSGIPDTNASASDQTRNASSQTARRDTHYSVPNDKDLASEGLSLPSDICKTKKTTGAGNSILDDAELEHIFKVPLVHIQLESWMQDQGATSSQPDSSAPREALDNLQDYIQQLPKEEIEGTQCTLCKDAVEMDDYWEFWNGKDKTVKNHTAFCNVHKRKKAWEEYRKEGYPTIDWDMLLIRIRKHRMPLFHILSNERPSTYRDRYEPLALTGRAAAAPSRRKDLPAHIQKELASYAIDEQSTYPGYYGPHGRRAITEHIMNVLKKEIKNCKDPVVQTSGPAAFVQAVLVPEMAVMLIMEDCQVDRERAEKIREHTYEMGMLLNEEIEDELEGQHDSDDDDDNEYQLP